MRSADATTLVRVALAVLIVYLIIIRFYPFLTVLLIGITIALDGLDGYLALREESKGKVGLGTYVWASMGDKKARDVVSRFKEAIAEHAPHGPRMDIAGDRVVEYLLWIVFTYLNVVPLFVLIIIVIRHSFADAIMGAKGTSSKMKTGFARRVYASNLGRGGLNVVKFLAFGYLVLVYVSGYSMTIGYALTAVLVAYILLRGTAEIYDSLG